MSSKTNYIDIINDISETYKNDEYMLQRFDFHMNNLTQILNAEKDTRDKRIIRTNKLETEKAMFIDVFLNKNRYYYLQDSQGSCFYEYDGKHYRVAKEDDIQHKIFTTIPYDNTLQEWKYKTKTTIIKKIKSTSLFSTIPESSTIQSVLKRLTPAVFPRRETAKYFLTIIGDNILKKNKDLIYLINGKAKGFLSSLDELSHITIGQTSVTRNFIKYHESHDYSKCRLINMADDVEAVLNADQSLNLFCVACHYSNRFGNADEYLVKKANENIKKYTLMLKNNSKEDIVAKFCENMIEDIDEINDETTTTSIVTWKDMHYLWKTYLSLMELPSMMYSATLKQLLIKKYDYSVLNDSFINITSKHLPRICSLINFWNNHIKITEDDELEIDELCYLLKSKNITIDEKDILSVIGHFFTDITIESDKYLTKVSCDLWDKKKDIQNALDSLKNKNKNKQNNNVSFTSFEDAYAHYCSMFSSKMVVSKTYFEKYISVTLTNYVEYDCFISCEWYNT